MSISKDEQPKIKQLTEIAQATLTRYEIRKIVRIIEQTPAGPKCHYLERKVEDVPHEPPYGGILIACPKGDTTNGALVLEISIRDKTLRVPPNVSSADAMALYNAYKLVGHEFDIRF